MKNPKKIDVSDFLVKNITNVLRNNLVYVFRILFNNDAQQISFNSVEKWLRKWYRNMNFSYRKKCIDEETHLKFCCIYMNKMRFLYIGGFILEACHICTASLIISPHGNVNNSTGIPPFANYFILL